MSEKPNTSKPAAVVDKFDAFCISLPISKSDEGLRNSFESFLVSDHRMLDDAARERHLNDFKAIEDIVPVLYELADLQGKS